MIPTHECKGRVESSAGASRPISTSPADSLPHAVTVPLHSAPQTQQTTIQSTKLFKLLYPTVSPSLSRLQILHPASADTGNIIVFGQPPSPSLPPALS